MSKLHTMAPRCSTASVHWSEVNTLLSAEQLQRSVQVAGAQPRMTQVWSKLAAGSPLKLGVIGASVAMEGGCQERTRDIGAATLTACTEPSVGPFKRQVVISAGRGIAALCCRRSTGSI